MNAYAVLLIALAAYLTVVLVGRRAGIWKKLDVTFYGPVMVLRTRRGRALMKKAASPGRFWRAYGTLAVIVTVAGMVAIFIFIVWQALNPGHWFLDSQNQLTPPHTDATLLFVYMILGLGLAVLVHEFVHGILAVVGEVPIESMGILLLLLPIGAFVEPNDPVLKKASRRTKLRLYASGPATNIVLSIIFALFLILFLAPSATPAEPQGAVVIGVAGNSPGAISGIAEWSEITSVEGVGVSNAAAFNSLSFEEPGGLVSVNLTYEARARYMALPGGIAATEVPDGPARNAGIRPGMIISKLDGTVIRSVADLASTAENATHERPVNITVLQFTGENVAGIGWFLENPHITKVNLTSKWLYYFTHYPSLNKDEYRNQSALGVIATPLGLTVVDPKVPIAGVAHPFAGVKDLPSMARASAGFFGQPFLGYSPVEGPITDLYEPSGILAPVPHDIYWLLVNIFYWAFWTNIVLGITNALPIIPMDGGLVLGDLLKGLAHRSAERLTGFDMAIGRRPITDKQIDQVMIGVTVLVSVLLIYLLLLRAL